MVCRQALSQIPLGQIHPHGTPQNLQLDLRGGFTAKVKGREENTPDINF